jgi:hypothetical protein
MFPKNSRYYGIDTAQWTLPDGRIITYLRRRFVPPGSASFLLTEYQVKKKDRLDNIAATYLQDPEQFWRIADANDALRPEDLTAEDREGQFLRIPLPQAR